MDPVTIGLAAVNAGLNYFGKEKDREIAEQNFAAQDAANTRNFMLAANAANRAEEQRLYANEQWERSFGVSQDQFNRNMAKQEEFAKMGIQWKVQDAIAAGLHPLYALGGGANYSPSSVIGASSSGFGSAPVPQVSAALRSGRSSASSWASAGQDLTRAIMASESKEARAMSQTMSALSLERAGLENDLLRAQIAKTNGSQLGPGMPGAPQAPPFVQDQPLKVTVSAPANAGQEPGGIPGLGYDVSEHGGTKYYYPVPSKDVKERIEDMHGPEFMWALRNNYLPSVGLYRSPPAHVPLEPGMEWNFHPMLGYYQHKPRKWIRGMFGYE